MTEDSEKECPICYEVIDVRAKKCPFCLHWQFKFYLIFYHPLFAVALLLVLITPFGYLFKAGVNEILDSGEDYANYQGALSVSNISMSFGKYQDEISVITLGEIYNESDLKWKDISVEVIYYNKDGKQVDIVEELVCHYNSAILPKGKAYFKMSDIIEIPKDQYFSSNVFVRYARDGSKKW